MQPKPLDTRDRELVFAHEQAAIELDLLWVMVERDLPSPGKRPGLVADAASEERFWTNAILQNWD